MLTGICLSLQAPALAIHPCSARVYPYTRTSSLAMQPICTVEPHLALTIKEVQDVTTTPSPAQAPVLPYWQLTCYEDLCLRLRLEV